VAFESLKQLNSKELFWYSIIVIGVSIILRSVAIFFVQVIAGGLSIFGWICLIWTLIKWNNEKKQKVEPKKE
jgi:hypothetical protein